MDAMPTEDKTIKDVASDPNGSNIDGGTSIKIRKRNAFKCPPSFVFSPAEMDAVVSEVEKLKDQLFGEYKEGESAMNRWMIWMKVAEKVNKVSTCLRTPDQVRLKWFEFNNQIPVTRNALRKKIKERTKKEKASSKRKANWWYDENIKDWKKMKENSPPRKKFNRVISEAKCRASSIGLEAEGETSFINSSQAMTTSTPIVEKEKEGVPHPTSVTPLSLKVKKKVIVKDIDKINLEPILVKEGNKLLKIVPIKKVNFEEVPVKVLNMMGKVSKRDDESAKKSLESQLARVTVETEIVPDYEDETEKGSYDGSVDGNDEVSENEDASEKFVSDVEIVVHDGRLKVDMIAKVIDNNWNEIENPEAVVIQGSSWEDDSGTKSKSDVLNEMGNEVVLSKSNLNNDEEDNGQKCVGEEEISRSSMVPVNKSSITAADCVTVEHDLGEIETLYDDCVVSSPDVISGNVAVGDKDDDEMKGNGDDGNDREIQTTVTEDKVLGKNSKEEVRNGDSTAQDPGDENLKTKPTEIRITEATSIGGKCEERVVANVVVGETKDLKKKSSSGMSDDHSVKGKKKIWGKNDQKIGSTRENASKPVNFVENSQKTNENDGISSLETQIDRESNRKKLANVSALKKKSTIKDSLAKKIEKGSRYELVDSQAEIIDRQGVESNAGKENTKKGDESPIRFAKEVIDQPTISNNPQNIVVLEGPNFSNPTNAHATLPVVGDSQQSYLVVPPGIKAVIFQNKDGTKNEVILNSSETTLSETLDSDLVNLKTYPPKKSSHKAPKVLFPIGQTIGSSTIPTQAKLKSLRPNPMQGGMLKTDAVGGIVNLAPYVSVPIAEEARDAAIPTKPEVQFVRKLAKQLVNNGIPGNDGYIAPSLKEVISSSANYIDGETPMRKRTALSRVRLLNRSLKKSYDSPVPATPVLQKSSVSKEASSTSSSTSSSAMVKDQSERNPFNSKSGSLKKATSKLSKIDEEAVLLLKGLQTGKWDDDLSAHVDQDILEEENSVVGDSSSSLPLKISAVWTMDKSPDGSEASNMEEAHLPSRISSKETVVSKMESDTFKDITVVPKAGTDNCFMIQGGMLELSDENNLLKESVTQSISYLTEVNQSFPSQFYIQNNDKMFMVHTSGSEDKCSSESASTKTHAKDVAEKDESLEVTVYKMIETSKSPSETNSTSNQPIGNVSDEQTVKKSTLNNVQSKVDKVMSQWKKILPKSDNNVKWGSEELVTPVVSVPQKGTNVLVVSRNVTGSKDCNNSRPENEKQSNIDIEYNDMDDNVDTIIQTECIEREIPKPLKELKVRKKIVLVDKNGDVISPSKLENFKKVPKKEKKKSLLRSEISRKKELIDFTLDFVPKEIEHLRNKFMKRRERIKAMESKNMMMDKNLSEIATRRSKKVKPFEDESADSKKCSLNGNKTYHSMESSTESMSTSKKKSENSHWLDRLVADLAVEEPSEDKSSKCPSLRSVVKKNSSENRDVEISKKEIFDGKKVSPSAEASEKKDKVLRVKRSLSEVFALGHKSSLLQPWMRRCRLDVEESSPKENMDEGSAISGPTPNGKSKVSQVTEWKTSEILKIDSKSVESKSDGLSKENGVTGSLEDGTTQMSRETTSGLKRSEDVIIDPKPSTSKSESILNKRDSDSSPIQVENCIIMTIDQSMQKIGSDRSNSTTKKRIPTIPKVRVIENGTNKVIGTKVICIRDMPSLDFSWSKSGNKISQSLGIVASNCQEKDSTQIVSELTIVEDEHRHPLVRAALVGDPMDFEAELRKDETDLCAAKEKKDVSSLPSEGDGGKIADSEMREK